MGAVANFASRPRFRATVPSATHRTHSRGSFLFLICGHLFRQHVTRDVMKPPQSENSSSPRVHSENIQRELSQLINHLEADTHRVTDRRFRGLLEKSAEVLKDLRSLFERFGPGDQ